jgi:hypothetical protein
LSRILSRSRTRHSDSPRTVLWRQGSSAELSLFCCARRRQCFVDLNSPVGDFCCGLSLATLRSRNTSPVQRSSSESRPTSPVKRMPSATPRSRPTSPTNNKQQQQVVAKHNERLHRRTRSFAHLSSS